MTAATAAERQRRHRARIRAARAHEWLAAAPSEWHPFLTAWAGRGLMRPPSPAQVDLLRPYVSGSRRGPAMAGAVLARVRRAGARHSRSTYGLIAAVRRVLEELYRLAADAKDAFTRPLSLDDPGARRERGEQSEGAERPPPRSSRAPSPGQKSSERFADIMRRHGMPEQLVRKLEGRDK